MYLGISKSSTSSMDVHTSTLGIIMRLAPNWFLKDVPEILRLAPNWFLKDVPEKSTG